LNRNTRIGYFTARRKWQARKSCGRTIALMRSTQIHQPSPLAKRLWTPSHSTINRPWSSPVGQWSPSHPPSPDKGASRKTPSPRKRVSVLTALLPLTQTPKTSLKNLRRVAVCGAPSRKGEGTGSVVKESNSDTTPGGKPLFLI